MKNEEVQKALQALGLIADADYTLTFAETASETNVYRLSGAAGVDYMLVAAGGSPEISLQAALRRTQGIAVGVALSSDYATYTGFRKNPRSGDIDIVRLETIVAGQQGFQFSVKDDLKQGRYLQPLSQKIENVLFDVHSALRDIDGLHAPDALDEICKLLYVKIFDEENSVKSKRYEFQRAIYHSVEECSASIRGLYQRAIDDDESVFSNRIPSYSRSRGVFRDPIMLSSQAIARAVTLLEDFDISGSPVDIKGRAFQNVIGAATRSGMGQYFTPKGVIGLCVSLLKPTVRDVIADPFCGSGHFLTASLDHVRSTGNFTEKQFHDFAFSRLHGLEKSDRMVRVAMTDMRLHGDGHSNIRCVDSLLTFDRYPDLNAETFDIILTNPPFGVDLPQESIAELGPFNILDERKSRQGSVSLEIIAIDRCLSLLRPGGRMAIVLPDGILSNRSTQYVREWIEAKSVLKAIISLPVDTFSPFGANIKTSILIIRKNMVGENLLSERQVFMADIQSVGYDASGRPTPCDNFELLSSEFSRFIEKEGW